MAWNWARAPGDSVFGIGASRDLLHRIEHGDLRVGLGVAFEAAILFGGPLFTPESLRLASERARMDEKLRLSPKAVHKRNSRREQSQARRNLRIVLIDAGCTARMTCKEGRSRLPAGNAGDRVRGLKLAMSNIGWPVSAAERAYRHLQESGFSGVEVAPGLLFASEDDPRRPSPSAVRSARLEAERHGLSLVAMQALHFGLPDAQLFGDTHARGLFVNAIDTCCDLARRLDIGVLTIGSAAGRSFPEQMGVQDAWRLARDTLLPAADRADKAGLKLAIEPIPKAYGTNFLNTLGETVRFVSACDHPAIRVNLDTGAMQISGELASLVPAFATAAPWLGHIHVCRSHLQPVTLDDAWIGELARLVQARADAPLWMSAEMRPSGDDDMLAVRTAAQALTFHALGGPCDA